MPVSFLLAVKVDPEPFFFVLMVPSMRAWWWRGYRILSSRQLGLEKLSQFPEIWRGANLGMGVCRYASATLLKTVNE